MNKLFSFHFLYHVEYMQFVTLQGPDSLIQWSVISTNFSKRLFDQTRNFVGHLSWRTKFPILPNNLLLISITDFKNIYPRSLINNLQSFREPTALTKTRMTAVSDITKTLWDKKKFFDFLLSSLWLSIA